MLDMLGRILSVSVTRLRNLISRIVDILQLRELNIQGKIGVAILGFFILVSIFGPVVAPYDPQERLHYANGKIKSLEPPSLQHPFGTTWQGRDVLSQVLYGAKPTLLVGLTAAVIIAFIGVNIGIISGYFGGEGRHVFNEICGCSFWIAFSPVHGGFGLFTRSKSNECDHCHRCDHMEKCISGGTVPGSFA